MKLSDLKKNPLTEDEAEWIQKHEPKAEWIPFAKDGTYMATIIDGKRYLIPVCCHEKKKDEAKTQRVAPEPKKRRGLKTTSSDS